LVNKKNWPLVHDARVFRGPDVACDQFLVPSCIAIPARWKKNAQQQCVDLCTFKTDLLKEEGI
jgi:hypothetical protein